MANYINKSILLEAYLHLEPDKDMALDLERIRTDMSEFLLKRSKFFLSPEVEVDVTFKEGSLKKYLTVLGCVYVFLHQYSDFREGVKLFASDAKRLAECVVSESLYVTQCRATRVIHCEARPGLLGALEKITDDLDSIDRYARAGNADGAQQRIKKAKRDLKRLAKCINDERDAIYLAEELEKICRRLPGELGKNEKKPASPEQIEYYRLEVSQLTVLVSPLLMARRKEIEDEKAKAKEWNGEGSYIDYLKRLSVADLNEEIDQRVSEGIDQLMDEDEVASLIASTNAVGFYVDFYEVKDIVFRGSECVVSVRWSILGEQLEDKAVCGDSAFGSCDIVFDQDASISFENIGGEIQDWDHLL